MRASQRALRTLRSRGVSVSEKARRKSPPAGICFGQHSERMSCRPKPKLRSLAAAGDVVADLRRGYSRLRRVERARCGVGSAGLCRRGPTERVQCSSCRESAHEEPLREKGVDFLGMACSSISFLPPFSKGPLSAGCAEQPRLVPSCQVPSISLGLQGSDTAAFS